MMVGKRKCKKYDLVNPKSLEEMLEHINHGVCDIITSKELFANMAMRIIYLEDELGVGEE